MKRIAIVAVLAVLLSFTGVITARADSPRFFSVLQDVPLMPGLAELSDQAVVFDKPSGRFAEVLADLGGGDIAGVSQYYEDVLPQFGWISRGKGRFARDGEILALEFEDVQGRMVARFSLSPEGR